MRRPVRCRSDGVGDRAQLRRRQSHVEGRADVEAHGDALQARHHEVFQAGPLQLLRRAEYFGADESGNVVDDHPCAGLLPDGAREPVRPRFERDHVDPFGRAIGHGGSLPGLEVQTVERTGEIQDRVCIEPDDAMQRSRCTGKTLEADVDACP
jgi:hypothetical protein